MDTESSIDSSRKDQPWLLRSAYVLITTIMVLGQLLGSSFFSVSALAAENKEIPITLSNEKLLHNGQEASTTITLDGDSETFDLSYDFELANTAGDIKAGDYFLLKDIPSVFQAASPLGMTVSVLDSNTGDTIASGKYTGETPMTFTFTKDMTEKEITGNIKFELEITNSGNFTFGGKTYTVTKKTDTGTDTPAASVAAEKFQALRKGGRYDYDAATNTLYYSWGIDLNHAKIPAGTYTITDKLPAYQTYDSSLSVKKGTMDLRMGSNGSPYLSQFKVSGNANEIATNETASDGTVQWTITIPEGNTSDYELSYKTHIKVDDPNFPKLITARGEVSATNSASITGSDGISYGSDSATFAFAAAGSGIGDYDTTGIAVVTKKDADTNSPLAAATFNLVDNTNKIIKTVTTGTNGSATVSGLAAGTYRFIETKAPDGYQLDSTPAEVTVTIGKTTSVTVKDKKDTGSVVLTKKDAATGTALAGAVFDLQEKDGTKIKTVTTGTDGTVTVDQLAPGDYQFVETGAPNAYQLDKTPVTFTIASNQKTAVQVEKKDVLKTGGVVLTKVDSADNTALQGAVFELQTKDGTVLQRALTTDTNGQLAVNDLAPNDYQFVETKAPTGYELSETPIVFTIVKNQTTPIKITAKNTLKTGGVVLTKVDDTTNTALAGAVFTLQTKAGAVVKTALTTDASGKIAVNDLTPGDYQFVETKAPAGYLLDDTPVSFTITKGQTKAVEVTAQNKLQPGSVVLTKTDAASGAVLAGAVFELQTKAGTVVQDALVTDAAGKISVDELAPGDYQFTETSAPTGYELSKTPIAFTIERSQKSAVQVNAKNTLKTGGVILTKVDAKTGTSLQGAVFELQTKTGEAVQSTLVTDTAGKIAKDGLAPGDYQFVETKAPAGYDLDKTPIPFTVVKNQAAAVQVKATNTLTSGSVVLTKVDAASGAVLAGAVFELQTAAKDTVKTALTTDASGKIAVNDLTPGDYQFVETKAPAGYDLDKTPVTFTIAKAQKKTVQVTADNTLTKGGVILTKVDSDTGQSLQGAVFELDTEAGKVIRSALTTDASGKIAVDGLTPGDYQFVETKAPTGYKLAKTPVTFTVKKGQTHAVEVKAVNKLITGSVILTKIDKKTAATLQGAVFDLQKADGTVIQSALTTDAVGKIAVAALVPGDYQFVETQAPAGYDLNAAPVTFTITGEQAAVEATAENSLTKGGVVLTKVDAKTAATLQGAVFELQAADGTVLEENLVTDSSGKLAVDELEPGDYRFVETQAPTGYELDAVPVAFTIEKGQTEAVQVQKADFAYEGSVILHKIDGQTGQSLAGAIFELQDSKGAIIAKELVTDDNGRLSVTKLVPGNYQFVETKAPKGYILDKTPVPFAIKDKTSAVTVSKENEQEKGSVRLEKRDSKTNALLSGAVFKLVNADGKIIKDKLTTDKNGVILVKDLALGEYRFIETQAPAGYQLEASAVKFVISQNDAVVSLTKVNAKTPIKPKVPTEKVPTKKVPTNKAKTPAKTTVKNHTYRAQFPKTNDTDNTILSAMGGGIIVGLLLLTGVRLRKSRKINQ